MKIGDKVRFLNEVGGGRIAAFRDKNIVLVEDEDGFQIPVSITDVVVVESEDYSMGNMVTGKRTQAQTANTIANKKVNVDVNVPVNKVPVQVEERKGGDQLNVYLAFVPIDEKQLVDTLFEAYIVNDSNYWLYYTLAYAEGNNWQLFAHGEVEPNTKEFLAELDRQRIQEMSKMSAQLIASKREKTYMLKPVVDTTFRIDAVKFYKLHTFQPNDFFEQNALLFEIVENDRVKRPLVVDTKQLKEAMMHVEPASTLAVDKPEPSTYVRRYEPKVIDQSSAVRPEGRSSEAEGARSVKGGKNGKDPSQVIKRKGDEDVLVVDLHATALLDTTAGLTNADILNYQMQKFRETMKAMANKKGQKIVFIHGKGEGVLRAAILNELRFHYKSSSWQDASFREYGYGATQVTIR